jgi:hypothetical protein
MTLSDTQETTLSGSQKSELGLLGIIQMMVSIGVIIYVYLVYGVRLNLKKGGIFYTLQSRQQIMNHDGCRECKTNEKKAYQPPEACFDFHKEA